MDTAWTQSAVWRLPQARDGRSIHPHSHPRCTYQRSKQRSSEWTLLSRISLPCCVLCVEPGMPCSVLSSSAETDAKSRTENAKRRWNELWSNAMAPVTDEALLPLSVFLCFSVYFLSLPVFPLLSSCFSFSLWIFVRAALGSKAFPVLPADNFCRHWNRLTYAWIVASLAMRNAIRPHPFPAVGIFSLTILIIRLAFGLVCSAMWLFLVVIFRLEERHQASSFPPSFPHQARLRPFL